LTLFSVITLSIFSVLKIFSYLGTMYGREVPPVNDEPFQRIASLQTVEMSGKWSSQQGFESFTNSNGTFTMNIVRYRHPSTNAKLTLKLIDGRYLDDHQLRIVAPFTTHNVKQLDNK
jgi:hypothetical protein